MVRPNRNVSSEEIDSSNLPAAYVKFEAVGNENANISAKSPLRDILDLEPSQMVVLSGPFPSNDNTQNILIARKIPQGYTVIAKPLLGAPPAPLLLKQDQITKLDPGQCSPILPSPQKEGEPYHCTIGCSNIPIRSSNDKSMTNPLVMMWNSQYPEGRLVPLRQPAPPVYFQTNT